MQILSNPILFLIYTNILIDIYMWVTKDIQGIKKWYNREPIKGKDGIWFSPVDFPCIEDKLTIEQLLIEGFTYLT